MIVFAEYAKYKSTRILLTGQHGVACKDETPSPKKGLNGLKHLDDSKSTC